MESSGHALLVKGCFLGLVVASTTALASAYRRWCQRPGAPLTGNSYARGSDVIRAFPGAATGRTYVVTGSSSGLGKHVAMLLCQEGASVVLAVRDVNAGATFADELQALFPAQPAAHVLELDLACLASVRKFARELRGELEARGSQLHGLCNNAGVFQVEGVTVDGFQLLWQTNCMAPALLTELLLPVASNDFRVVNVSSKLHKIAPTRVAAACPPHRPGGGYADYALSKACQVLHACDLNVRFAHQHQVSKSNTRQAFAVEPGLVQTRIMRHSSRLVAWLNYAILAPFVKTIDQGTATIMFCLLAPADHVTRGFYFEDCRVVAPSRACGDEEEAEALAKVFRQSWGSDPNFQHETSTSVS